MERIDSFRTGFELWHPAASPKNKLPCLDFLKVCKCRPRSLHSPALGRGPHPQSCGSMAWSYHGWPAEGGAAKCRGGLWSPRDRKRSSPTSAMAIWSKCSRGHPVSPLPTIAWWPYFVPPNSSILLISFPVELFGPQWRSFANKSQGFERVSEAISQAGV